MTQRKPWPRELTRKEKKTAEEIYEKMTQMIGLPGAEIIPELFKMVVDLEEVDHNGGKAMSVIEDKCMG